MDRARRPLAFTISPTGEVEAWCDETARVPGAPSEWAGLAELLAASAEGLAEGDVELPGGTTVRLLARRLQGAPTILVTEIEPPAPAASELRRATRLVEEAEEAVAHRDAALERLQALCERLLEAGSVAAVLDSKRRIRGWSRTAEAIWEVPPERAVGRPASSVLIDLDHGSIRVQQRVGAPSGDVVVILEPLTDDASDLVLRITDK